MFEQAFRIREADTEGDGACAALEISLHRLHLSFVAVHASVGQEQFDVVHFRLLLALYLRTFIFQIFALVHAVVGEHFRHVADGSQQAGRRDQTSHLVGDAVYVSFEGRCHGGIGIVGLRPLQLGFGLLHFHPGHLLFRIGLVQTDFRDDILFHHPLDALRFIFGHLITCFRLLEIGLRLFHLLGIFFRAQAEQRLSFGNFLAFVYQYLLDETFHFRLDFHKLDGLHIGHIRLGNVDGCRLKGGDRCGGGPEH